MASPSEHHCGLAADPQPQQTDSSASPDETAPFRHDDSAALDEQDQQLVEEEKKWKKKRRNRGNKSTAQRGPTALHKNRGTGFEGTQDAAMQTPS